MSNAKPHSKSQSSTRSKSSRSGAQQGLPPVSRRKTRVPSGTIVGEVQTLSVAVAPTTSTETASEASPSPILVKCVPPATSALPEEFVAASPAPLEAVQIESAPVEEAHDEFFPVIETVQAKLPPFRPAAQTQGVLPAEVVRGAQAHPGASPKTSEPKFRPRARPHWGVWLGAGLGVVLLVAGSAVAGAYSRFASSDQIAPNVFIAGVPVGGLTQTEAVQRVRSHFGSPRIALRLPDQTIAVPVSQLGVRLSVEPTVKKAFAIGRDGSLSGNLLSAYGSGSGERRFALPIEWNKTQLVQGLQTVAAKVAEKPVDARLRAGENGLEVVPDRTGRELNVGEVAHVLQHKYFPGLSAVSVSLHPVQAKVTAHDLAGRDVQLAQYTTTFNSGLAGRTENIRIACRAIQNHVLMPGETFSFNGCTGERTANKGYRMAHIFIRQPGAESPEVADGLAGGVCQVSSTLFNAVRKTNAEAAVNPIKIVERNTHSLPVTYVPHGLDATVAWPGKDFRFRNITDHPVYVKTEMGRSKLSISIWGRVPLSS